MALSHNCLTVNRKVPTMLLHRLSVVISGILISAAIQADVYRWVDENGVTVYSQVPPPADVQKKKIEAPPAPPVTEKEAWSEVNQPWKKMRDREDLIKEQSTADSEQLQKQQAREKNCETAQRSIEELSNADLKFIRKSDGTIERLSADERRKQLSKAREMEKEHCK